MVMRERRRKPAGDPRRAARGATTPKRATPARPRARAAPVQRPRPRARAAPRPRATVSPRTPMAPAARLRKPAGDPRRAARGATQTPRSATRERTLERMRGTILPPPSMTRAPFLGAPVPRPRAVPKRPAQARVSPRTPIGPARVPMRGFATGGRSLGPVARKSLPSREVAARQAASSGLAARQAAQMRGPTGNLPIPESRADAKGRIAAARNRAATRRVRPQQEPEQMFRQRVSPYVPPRGAVGISPRTSPGTPLGPAAPTQQQRAQQQEALIRQRHQQERQGQARIAHAREGRGTRPAEGGGFWHRHE